MDSASDEDTTMSGGMYVEMDEDTHEQYEENFADFMTDIQNHVKQLAAESSRAPQDAYEAFQAFSSAVDWSESWLRGLLCFHAILFLIVLFTRKNTAIQSILFLYICFLVLMAEYINSFCAQHWESFATQNYFDTHGSFAAVVYAAPLLIIALLQMINFLVLASSALIKAKRMEIQVKKKAESKKGETKKKK
mmetsp:Transcript_2446/g.4453  ORF Transcript_2446/g.4453 Transcript_2446/m.4453 type:complete len:192 (+) Transcript_2446:73-648(+)